MIHIFKNYFKISLILIIMLTTTILYIDNKLLPSALIGYMIAVFSFALNYKGSFFFLEKSNDTFGFFIMLSFFVRIAIVIVVGIILTLESSDYLAPYIIGYSLNLVSVVYIALRKERRALGDKRNL